MGTTEKMSNCNKTQQIVNHMNILWDELHHVLSGYFTEKCYPELGQWTSCQFSIESWITDEYINSLGFKPNVEYDTVNYCLFDSL